MDSLALDVSSASPAEIDVGAWATLIGGVDRDELGKAAGTISYVLLTRLGPRVSGEYFA